MPILIGVISIDGAYPKPMGFMHYFGEMTKDEKTPFMNSFFEASQWHGQWIHLYSFSFFDQLLKFNPNFLLFQLTQ